MRSPTIQTRQPDTPELTLRVLTSKDKGSPQTVPDVTSVSDVSGSLSPTVTRSETILL